MRSSTFHLKIHLGDSQLQARVLIVFLVGVRENEKRQSALRTSPEPLGKKYPKKSFAEQQSLFG